MRVRWVRRNPIFFEQDGSWNPSWLIIAVLVVALVGVVIATFRSNSVVVQVTCISALVTTLNIFTIAALSQNKAKILADAKSPGEVAKAMTDAVRPIVRDISTGDDAP